VKVVAGSSLRKQIKDSHEGTKTTKRAEKSADAGNSMIVGQAHYMRA